MDSSCGELNALIAEAANVVADSERYLENAEELVIGIPERRSAVEKSIVAAQKLYNEAHAEWVRVINDESSTRRGV